MYSLLSFKESYVVRTALLFVILSRFLGFFPGILIGISFRIHFLAKAVYTDSQYLKRLQGVLSLPDGQVRATMPRFL